MKKVVNLQSIKHEGCRSSRGNWGSAAPPYGRRGVEAVGYELQGD